MARVLGVNLSIEWQCEQLACANALPAATLAAAEGLEMIVVRAKNRVDDKTVKFATPRICFEWR